MDIAYWRARCFVVDVLGLIGRHWLMALGWSLFVLAISEPARADSFGNNDCGALGTAKTSCEGARAGMPASLQPSECRVEAQSGSTDGSLLTVTLYLTNNPYNDPNTPNYNFAYSSWNATCPPCSASGSEANEGGFWNWSGDQTHQECFGGCWYVPAPGGSSCGSVSMEFAGETIPGPASCTAELLMPTGGSCVAQSGAPATPDDIPPKTPSPVCAQIAGAAVCIDHGQTCDGYFGSLNGENICVPKDPLTPCVGPFCSQSDPPGDADNDEDNGDTPDAEIHTTYTYPQDGSVVTLDDIDFFIPSASFPAGNGCAPCPFAGDPDDPRDPEEPPPPDLDGDGTPDVDDPDLDGDGKPNGEDDDTDGDGVSNGEDDDIDGDGISNGDDDDDDGDGQTGSGSDGNGVDPDDNGDGTPDGVPEGDSDGECDPATGEGCAEGEASGGASCDAPPVCSGDPVTCMVAYQAWETRCSVDEVEDALTGDAAELAGFHAALTGNTYIPDADTADGVNIDPAYLDSTGSLTAECAPITIDVLGSTWVIDLHCQLLVVIGSLIMVSAHYAAYRILTHVGGV